MKTAELFKDIRYVGQAEGDRKTYRVFEGKNEYLVVGPTRDGYYVNVVAREAPEVITRAFKRKKVTSVLVKRTARRADLFPGSRESLRTLYVMVALRRARKLRQRQGKAMVFKIN